MLDGDEPDRRVRPRTQDLAQPRVAAAVEQVFGQEREQLDEGDAGIALPALRPLGRVHGHARDELAEQLPVSLRGQLDRDANR